MWWLALFLMQDGASQADRIRAAMAPSIEQQQASIRRQQAAVRATPAGARASAISLPGFPPASISYGGFSVPRPAVSAAMFTTCDPLPQPELTRLIGAMSQKIGIDGGLVREVARQESGFRPCAISPKGAEGLMQLMPATQAQFAVSNPFDPEQSLEAGSKLLKQLLDRYHGDLTLALSAYNAGAGCVDRSGGIPDIQETKNYVLSILSRSASFEDPEFQDLAPPALPFSSYALTSRGCQPAVPAAIDPRPTP
jgi:soluble lytic murein transglycosylase-like protein